MAWTIVTKAMVVVLASGCSHTPRDMVAFFNSTTCPSGWSDVPEGWRGRYVVIESDSPGRTVGNALVSGESRITGEHSHLVDSGGRQVLVPRPGCNVDNSCRRTGYFDSGDAIYEQEGAALRVGSVRTGPNETTVEGTNAPYVNLKACSKT
jgi:hypothetical protein